MNLCREKLSSGKSCPNQVDEGQEYCPFHLANQDKKAKNILTIAGAVISAVTVGFITVVKIVAKRT